MAGARVIARAAGLAVVGHGRIKPASGSHVYPPELGAPIDVAGAASLTSLKTAMGRWTSTWSPTRTRRPNARLWFTELPPDAFDDPGFAPQEDVELTLDGDTLEIHVAHFFELHKGEPDIEHVLAVITPTVESRGAEISRTWFSDDQDDHPGYYMLDIWMLLDCGAASWQMLTSSERT